MPSLVLLIPGALVGSCAAILLVQWVRFVVPLLP